MPIYEYRCGKCGQKFELIRSFSEADAVCECPGCHSTDNKRQLSKVNAFSDGTSLSGSSQCGSCSSGNCSCCGSC